VVKFWAHKVVIFVRYCIPQFAYCAVAVVEDFDAVVVCYKTVVACVEPRSLQLLVFWVYFCCFPHVVLMFCHCLIG
jgi:hypothetical protein